VYSRNELKEKNVDMHMQCMEESLALKKELAAWDEELLNFGKQAVYQPKGCLFNAGSAAQLQKRYDAISAARTTIQQARASLASQRQAMLTLAP
jgi:hypothetical protein